jgi:hypothetical protein
MKLNEILNEEILLEMPREDLIEAQKVLDAVFKKYLSLSFDLSYHFNQRVLDKGEKSNKLYTTPEFQKSKGRGWDITKKELYGVFHKLIADKKQRGKLLGAKQFGKEVEGVIRDAATKINIVFKVAYQERTRFPLFRIITIKRDEDFTSKRHGDMILDL